MRSRDLSQQFAGDISRFDRTPPAENLHETPASQLLESQARRERLFLGDRAAVQRAQEVIQEALTGSGVVENVADERRLPGLLDEIAETVGSGGEAFQEEGVNGGVTRGKVRRIPIPPLVETVDQRGGGVF